MPISAVTMTPFNVSGTSKSPTQLILGTHTLRASAALTTSYVQSNYCYVGQVRSVTLRFSSTWVDSTSIQYYVAWSWDGTTWFRSTNWAASGGTNTGTLNNASLTLGASTNWTDTVAVQAPYISVYAQKTGGSGADALAIYCDCLGV